MNFIHNSDVEQLCSLQECLDADYGNGIRDIWVIVRPYYIAVVEDGKIVGVVSISLGSDASEIYKLYVMPSYARRGLGTALVNEALRFLSELKVPEVYLEIVGDSYDFWSKVLEKVTVSHFFGEKYIIHLS